MFSMAKEGVVGRRSETLTQVTRGRPYQVMVVKPNSVVGGSLFANCVIASREVRACTGSRMSTRGTKGAEMIT